MLAPRQAADALDILRLVAEEGGGGECGVGRLVFVLARRAVGEGSSRVVGLGIIGGG
jgi:hypothetical protein